MPSFRTPRLDDKSYDDLRRELVRRIPVHSAEWTDHNAGDPGIALLEVFAWLSENLLYRLNRVPDKAQLEFLNLLDVPLAAAEPARAMVRVDLDRGELEPQLLPFGPTAGRTLASAGKLQFQVLDELEVLPVEALAAVKAPGPSADDPKVIGLEEVKQALEDNLGAPPDTVVTYVTKILAAPADGALPEATAIGAAVDRTLWIALVVPEALAKKATLAEVRKRLAGRVISVGVRLDAELCGPDDVERCPAPGAPEATLPVVWQIATGKFKGNESRVDKLRYDRLAVEGDSTAGLSRSGVWRLRLPQSDAAFGTWDGIDAALAGAADLPPPLDDDQLAARVITWVRCFRPPPDAGAILALLADDPCADEKTGTTPTLTASLPQPVVRWVDVNVVAVEQAVTAAAELLGNGAGRPGQTLKLAHAPVIAGSLYLEVREPAGWVQWREVDTLGASGPGDPRFVLDPAAGEIRFGDGIHGRLPRPGEVIRARSYRHGGGVVGNVPASAINRITPPAGVAKLRVVNPLAAEGGVDGETLEQARARVPLVIRHGNRAVAAEDFRDLAMETPGANLGRVEVLPRHKPQERVDGVPGVVTLIVVPAYDALHPDEPVPDREVLRRVCAYLEPRRLVTTELYVTPPEYVPVWISAAFEVDEGYGVQTVRRWVELAIRQYLAPLPPYGPAGKGWPFGRDVSAPDVEAAVLRVEGVRLVNKVLVAGADPAAPLDKPVKLASWQLAVVRGVQLNTDGPVPDPIDRDGDSARPGGSTPVAVPVIEEVC